MFAGAGYELANVGFGEGEDLGDAGVGVVEGFAEDVGCALGGVELFEEEENGEGESLGAFGAEGGIGGRVDGFGEPWADVGLAAGASGGEGVDGEAGGGGNEEGGGVEDDGAVGALPAQPDFLDEVFGLGGGAEHAIGDAEETRSRGEEGLRRVVEIVGICG